METGTLVSCAQSPAEVRSRRTPRATFSTQREAESLPPPTEGARYAWYRHAEEPGLYLRVSAADESGHCERLYILRVVKRGPDGRPDDQKIPLGRACAHPQEAQRAPTLEVIDCVQAVTKARAERSEKRGDFHVPTVREGFEQMLEHRIAAGLLNPTTAESHRRRFERVLAPYSDRRLNELDAVFWQELYKVTKLPLTETLSADQQAWEVLNADKTARELARKGIDVRSRRAGLSQAYGASQIASAIYTHVGFILKTRHHYTLGNPIAELRKFEKGMFEQPAGRTALVEVVHLPTVAKVLLEDTSRGAVAYWMYLTLGYRASGALSARWEQLDWERATFRVPPLRDPKTQVPREPGWKRIPGHVLPVPKWLLEEVLFPYSVRPDAHAEWMFPASSGGRPNRTTKDKPYMQDVRRTAEKLSKALGYHVTPHMARKTFGTLVHMVAPNATIRKRMLTHNLVANATNEQITSLYNPTATERLRPHWERLMELLLQLIGIKTMSRENQAFLRQHGWTPEGLALIAETDSDAEGLDE